MRKQFVGKIQTLLIKLLQTTTYGGKNAFPFPLRPADKFQEEESFLG
jgi:hypothetical protein